MDFKTISGKLAILVYVFLFISGCADPAKQSDTYFVEFVNFNYDSLKHDVAEKTIGKASFYKNKKVEIVSVNYVTDGLEDLHYFLDIGQTGANIDEGARKIRVELLGGYNRDSIKYSLQKYIFKNKAWQKTSDLGTIRAFRTAQTNRYIISDYGDHIQKNIVMYTYD